MLPCFQVGHVMFFVSLLQNLLHMMLKGQVGANVNKEVKNCALQRLEVDSLRQPKGDKLPNLQL